MTIVNLPIPAYLEYYGNFTYWKIRLVLTYYYYSGNSTQEDYNLDVSSPCFFLFSRENAFCGADFLKKEDKMKLLNPDQKYKVVKI